MRHALVVGVLCVGLLGLGCRHEHGDGGPNYPGPDPDETTGSDTDGTSCDTTSTCPDGQIAVLEGPVGAESCVCRFACVPSAATDGGADGCPTDRVCVQLEDQSGNALTGQGSCEPVNQGVLGDPCGPQQCQDGLVCSGYSADTSYCRALCDADGTCPLGFACTPVSEYGAPSVSVCFPTVGTVAEGAACSVSDPCQQDLFCTGGSGGGFCRAACDPWTPVCPTTAQCLRVEDPEERTLGYACIPTT